MTTAHGTRHFGLWGLPVCPIVIEHELATLDGIAGEVLEGFQALSRGGLEVGGLLFGTSDDGRLRITGFEPVACEHAFGPSFKLSHHDKQALEEQLRRHAALAASMSRVVVGWYHSHTRSELAFSAEDAELHDRFFPETWQVALILRPERDLSIGARFFFREPDGAGEHSLVPYAPFCIEYQTDRQPARSSHPVAARASRPQEEAPRGPSPVSKPVVTLRPTPREVVALPAPPPRPRKLMLAALAVILLAVGALLYLRFGRPGAPPPTVLRMDAGRRNGVLELTWDAAAAASAQGARLEIRDGGLRKQVTLDRSALAAGRYEYAPKSDVTAFLLKAKRSDGSAIEGSAMVVAPEVPPEHVARAEKEFLAKRKEPAIPGTRETVVAPLRPPPERRSSEPSVALRPAAAEPVRRTSPPPPSADERAKVIPQPSPPAPQPPASAPVQTAQIPQQTPQERPVVQTPPPVEPKPPAALAPSVQQPQTPAERSVTPTPVRPSPKPPQPPQVRLSGRWNLQPGGYSRSPAVPQTLSIEVSEDEAGLIQGTLEARYRSQSKTERVSLSFAGRLVNGLARFPFNSSDGRHGEIEFIRIPNSPDTMEVVWYGSDVKQPFDEIVKRGN